MQILGIDNSLTAPNALDDSRVTPAPDNWANPSTHTECTLHQLSPYIGKLKSGIASELIEKYSKPGDLIVDPFAGSGTIPLEAAILGRRTYAADASPYAFTLTKGKLFAPQDLHTALAKAEALLEQAAYLPSPDLRRVPLWVRAFFHPKTLKEAINFSLVAKQSNNAFLLSCLLGILHHQRPGFLSYPSSHLVPYLRDKKFPQQDHPELYEYRPLRPRLIAKIQRAYRRIPNLKLSNNVIECVESQITDHPLPNNIDCLITSPPYMNALDYGRDNRLRLWLLGVNNHHQLDKSTGKLDGFKDALTCLAKELHIKLKNNGRAIFIVGDKDSRRRNGYPSSTLATIISQHAPSLKLDKIYSDSIPDIRRSRRNFKGIKKEYILFYTKDGHA